MNMHFKVVGLSYRYAPLEIRELMSLDEVSCKKLMAAFRIFSGISDILILSTCNRTEIYYSAEKDYSKELICFLGIQKNMPNMEEYSKYFITISDHNEAVQHMFEVSAGLDSQVLGDAQISNQVKQAYQWSVDEDMASPFLHRLMHMVFATHKRIARETSFRSGTASVSYATVELVEALSSALIKPKILVVGLGEIGIDVCRYLIKSSLTDITVINRTFSKAEEFTRDSSLKAIPFEQLREAITEADIIISSVRREQPLITKEEVGTLSLHNYKHFIDLSVPRSIDPALEDNPGVLVYNVDYFTSKTTKVLERRMNTIPEVREIIKEAVTEMNEWRKEMEVSPVIQQFKEVLEQIRQQEIKRYHKTLVGSETELIELITKNIMQKIIKVPVVQLKAACKRGESENMIGILHELFDLDKQYVKNK